MVRPTSNVDGLTALLVSVASGVIVIVCQRTWKIIGKWQDGRKNVDQHDHDLLHQIADVMLDKPAGIFTKASPGLVSRFDTLESTVNNMSDKVTAILEKLG
jgi:hypothetical protein